MTPLEEFEALDRIFNVIKNYRQQREGNLDPLNNDLVKAYLANHLLSQDLQLWLRLEAQENLSEFLRHAETNWNVKQLLRQFKRDAHGLIDSWHQSHSLN